MGSIVRIATGILLIIAGLWALNHWHYMLWISGGPDRGPDQVEYTIPYFLTSAVAVIGALMVWKGWRRHK